MRSEIKRSLALGACLVFATGVLAASRASWYRKTRAHPLEGTQTQTSPAGQSITLLPNGNLLLLGGEGPNGLLKTAAIKNASDGSVTMLSATLTHARAWHTTTVLPDGTVLILGGKGENGAVIGEAELFDPATEGFTNLPSLGLIPRAFHTTTLLTDSRLLIAGGISSTAETLDTVELWDFRGKSRLPLDALMRTAREGQTATLLPNGAVLFRGGLDKFGNSLDYGEVFDPATELFSIEANPSQLLQVDRPLHLEASIPENKDDNVPVNAYVALRFSRALAVQTVNPSSIQLAGPEGILATKVIAAEGGILAFITPKEPLHPGTTYTVSLAGLSDLKGASLPETFIAFTTVGKKGSADTGIISSSPGATADPLDSAWRKLPPLKAAPGVTALSGQILTLDGEPLGKVTLEIEGGNSTRTDGTGRFLLERLTPGHHVMWIDGQTANSLGKTYGLFEVGVDMVAGQTSVLNYTIWMPLLDMAHAMAVSFPTQDEVVVKSPLLPGLELHLPPKTTILDRKGNIVNQISITPIPVNQPPFPLPTGVSVPLYFTIQPGGAYIRVENSSGPQGARLFYPNSFHYPVGTVFNFWDYDADSKGWFIYGQGAVSADQSQVVPNPGVVIYEFTGAMVANGYAPPTGPKPGNPKAKDGDPADLGTGLFIYSKTDLFVQDVISIALTRTYRPGDSASRAFGIGTTHPYDIFLDGANSFSPGGYTWVDLILPDGGRVHFIRTSPCLGTNGFCDFSNAVYTCVSPTSFYGATMQWTGAQWMLITKDGTAMYFPESDFPKAVSAQGAAITAMQDRYGNVLTFTRDSSKNLTKITTQNGRWIQLAIDTSGRITQATDNIGRTVKYAYDASNRLSTVTDENNGVTTYTYDSGNNMLTIKDPRGIVYLTNQYDANNRVIKQTLGDNSTYQFAYTLGGNGKVTQTNVTDPRGYLRQVMFNSDGYVISDTYALGKPEQQTFTYTRQPVSNLILSVTDALNRQTAYTYDAVGNVTSITKLAGTANAVTTYFAYESKFNRVTATSDPLGHTTTFTYDSKGNLIGSVDPLGNATSTAYNSAGQPVSITDPLGNTTQFAYDLGDLVAITDPLGRTTYMFVDSAGRPASVTDPLGRITKSAYNPLNQVTSVTDPLGGVTSFSYDGNGNLLSATDANNHMMQYTYDNMDRMATRKDALQNQESYVYDGNGNVTQFTDRRGKITTYTYDGLNRRNFAGFGTQAGPTYESTITYTYDSGSRLTKAVDTISGTITRGYDGLDRLTSDATPQGTVNYTYDAAGRRASLTVPGQAVANYTFDNANRLTQITQGTTTVSFGYDSTNRRTTLTLPNGIVTSYSYDSASQLAGITYQNGLTTLGNLTYSYDLIGRMTNAGGSFARTGLPNAVGQTGYNANNQLTTWGTANLFYDLNGNMTSSGTDGYTWDARNRLVSTLSGASFQYDAFGRRTTKTIAGTTTSFLYDGANVVQEVIGGTNTANSLMGGADEVFQRGDSAGTRGFLTDALGSTLALADSTGSLQTQYTFEPFGNTTLNGSSTTNSFAYTGRELDATSLYFYRARYYNPTLQRFISEDPIGLVGGINFYAYVENGPITRIDPFGLDWVYSQSSGQMTHIDNQTGVATPVGTGYAGHNFGLNNPWFQHIAGGDANPDAGPLPQGTYTIGPQRVNKTKKGTILPGSMRLIPDPSNDMFDRAGFLIHGGNMTKRSSSLGCIVLPPAVRNTIAASGDKVLRVVP